VNRRPRNVIRIPWSYCLMLMLSSLGGACISICMRDATYKPQMLVFKTYRFKHNVKDDQIIHKKLQILNLLIVELNLHNAHHGIQVLSFVYENVFLISIFGS
jgi:hypothetical protein